MSYPDDLNGLHTVTTPRFLSIQSHVVSGYCGNKSATFPLQLLGFEVDIINSVQLSNHTQYKSTKGQIYTSKDLDDIFAGLEANNLIGLYDFIISGYVADVSYIQSMATIISKIKKVRQALDFECLYTFDPVLGDDDIGFYVPDAENIVAAYKEYLLPIADVITPNRFEATILTSVDIDRNSPDALGQALEAVRVLHQIGVGVVALTSLDIEAEGNNLVCILSRAIKPNKNSLENNSPLETEPEVWIIRIPKLDCVFCGTGDLFACLITAWLRRTNYNLGESLEKTINTIHGILEDTYTYYKSINDGSVFSKELRIIQNQSKILSPNRKIIAEQYNILSATNNNKKLSID